MDSIDVGGASKNGRPTMPVMTTVDPNMAEVDDGTVYARNKTAAAVEEAAASARVQRSLANAPFAGSAAAYPESHPANREDIDQTADGNLVLTKSNENRAFDMHKPLGDVRNGYVTGGRGSIGSQVDPGADEAFDALKREVEAVKTRESMSIAAHDVEGAPLIEVLFHLDVGVLSSYHTHVVEQDKWLVFVDDNRLPASQKFIPKPATSADPLRITITGRDRVSQERYIVPLGINFTLGHHDLFVTMLASPKEPDQEA